MNHSGSDSADSRVLHTLKDGYWDRTEVIKLPDGARRVRKRSKGEACGPWGVRSLRREIGYLTSLPQRARANFPPVLASWDDESGGRPDVGYEMPFYPDHTDAGALARSGNLTQQQVDEFQDTLAEAVLGRLHERVTPDESLAAHVTSVVGQAWTELEKDPGLAALINAESIELNGETVSGPRAAFERIARGTSALEALDSGPVVRLHGDLFLENILWRMAATAPAGAAPRLILIDPVSVAGVMCGPPVFDLVKYVSYASGELPALRSGMCDVHYDSAPSPCRCHYRIRRDDPALEPFRALDWHTRFHRAFAARHGAVNQRLYHLIDAYFSAAMAVNTTGPRRLARLLKATAEFNAILKLS